jgi:hypothetical protein
MGRDVESWPVLASQRSFQGFPTMRKRLRYSSLFAVSLLAGCGESITVPPSEIAIGPHQGTAFRLPDNQGFAEIVNEPKPQVRGSKDPTSIVVYFLETDGKTPISAKPTDVKVDLTQQQKTVAVALAAEPKSDDPAGASRFASKPGPYQLAGARGKLVASVGGQRVEKVFAGGR